MTEHNLEELPLWNEKKSDEVDTELKVEREDEGANSDAHPWDPDKIRITTKHFTLREVVDQIQDKDIDLAPDFQRDYVWDTRQKIKLVESVLLGIPLPAFYFNQDSSGIYQIVDGVQRLNTIASFMNGEYCLNQTHLEYLKQLDGLGYSELSPLDARRFRATQIVAHVIEPSTPEAIKYDIFSRVNTLGSPLKPQEIRHAMSSERSRDFLKMMIEKKEFDEATNYNFWSKKNGKLCRDSGRMTDRELILRFCAFKLSKLDDYKKYSSLDSFLIDFTRRLDGKNSEVTNMAPISDEQLSMLEESFASAMRSAHRVLGDNAFRRSQFDKRRGPINRAIFESQSIALSEYPYESISKKASEINDAFIQLFNEQEYTKSVTVGTGAPVSVSTRLNKTRNALKGVLK